MKKTFHTILLLFSTSITFAQIDLSVKIERSKSDYEANFIVDTLSIFKDEILFKKIPWPDSFAFNENVPNGKYRFQYNNLFGERIEKKLDLKEENNKLKRQKVKLYIDKLQDSIATNLFVQRIKNNETILIKFKSSGCFSSNKDSLVISKKDDKYYLLHKRRKRKLSPKDIQALISYENELKHLKNVSFVSTSNGFNELILNSEKYFYMEPSTYWGGFEILKKKLNIK